MSILMTTFLALTEAPPGNPDPSTGKGPEWGKAAPIGLLVILLLAVATFFLLRSMTRNLKKVPASFDPQENDIAGELTVESPGPAAPGQGPEVEPGSSGLVNGRSG